MSDNEERASQIIDTFFNIGIGDYSAQVCQQLGIELPTLTNSECFELAKLSPATAEMIRTLFPRQVYPSKDSMEEIASMKKCSFKKGDVIVLTCERPITISTAERIAENVKRELPAGVKVLLLESGLELSVLSQEDYK